MHRQGEEAGTRALKALGTGVITAVGSKLAGGGIAGEIGKRLTNRIANGTVRAASGWGGATLKQGVLGATQNAAGAAGDKLAEGERPDINEIGKLAVKGAADGSVGGAALHHAVVPTEGRAKRLIEGAANGNKNAHTLEKHGKQTTREQQLNRATEGINPDGKQAYKTDSSRWLRNVDTSDGLEVAKRFWKQRRQFSPGRNDDVTIFFDKPIGEGYLKNNNQLIKTNKAVFRFNEKGDLITSYPKIGD